jgi:glycosyltransferase involved in cell wall biosynthesis
MEYLLNSKKPVVSPVYKADGILVELTKRISNVLSKTTTNYEIILVEDCSPDSSWERILENCKENKTVRGLRLSRNFGQHYAIAAGLENSTGKWVVVMDCDLQDLPKEIENLHKKTKEGYEVVLAQRIQRKDNFLKKCLLIFSINYFLI